MTVNQSLSPRLDRASDNRLFLREEELATGAHLILAAGAVLARQLGAAMARHGLNRSQADILLALLRNPGVDVSGLRHDLGMTVPTLARLLGQLDTAGLVDRTRSSNTDARRRALYLTDNGAEIANDLLAPLSLSVKRAYRNSGADTVQGMRVVLEALLAEADDAER